MPTSFLKSVVLSIQLEGFNGLKTYILINFGEL